MNLQQGMLCGLTNRKADFDIECADFKTDETLVRKEVAWDTDQEVQLHGLSEGHSEKLKAQQNFPVGIMAGIAAGLVGAIIWAIVTVATGYQIGYMAIGIGFIVGYAIRFMGKGIDMIFGISGAVIAILSCFLGNFLSSIGFIADYQSMGYMETLISFDYSFFMDLMIESFGFMDVLFYGFAAFEGYKLSFRKVTEVDLQELGD
jgi:hypothetical protein